MSRYISASFQRIALELADRAAEGGAVARVLDRLLERAFGEAQRDAGVEAALRVERVQELAEAVLAR